MQQYVELLSLEDITSIYYRNESQIIRSIRDHLKKYCGSFRIHNVILLSKQLRFVITNLYIPSTEKLEPELINIYVDVKPKITDLATVICELSARQMIMDKEARYRDREIAQLKRQQKHEVEMATTEEKKEDDCYQLIPKKAAFNPRKSLKQQLMEMGVAGLSEQIDTIEKQIFIQMRDHDYAKKINAHRAKGLLLYGPPGCGKSYVAARIADLITDVDIVLVDGPSLKNMYVGNSEKNVRKIFERAEKDTNKNNVHVIIIDEMDSLFPNRTTADRHNNSVVTQFLAKMDGVIKDVTNILIIGTTNREDMVDPAVKRPGRMELKLEVKLPDREGLSGILDIHMKDAITLSVCKLLPEEKQQIIDKMYLKKYSCADVKGLCDRVKNESVSRHFHTGRASIDYSDFINCMK